MLGFYMSSHPLTRHAGLLQALATHQVADLADVAEKSEVILGGMIASVQVRNVQKSRSGLTRMAKLTFEDLTGSVPAMLWPEEFAKNEALVKDDTIVFVRGTLDRRRDPAELIITRSSRWSAGPPSCRAGWSSGSTRGSTRPTTWSASSAWSGSIPATSTSTSRSSAWPVRRAVYKAGASLKIRHDDRLVPDLEAAVGAGNVRLLGHRGATARVESTPAPPRSPPRTEPDEASRERRRLTLKTTVHVPCKPGRDPTALRWSSGSP